MRASVASLRDVRAEIRAKEKAEAPTVKTEEQAKADEEKAAKAAKLAATATNEKTGAASTKEKTVIYDSKTSIWSRKFRPIPEAKAVDLFADVLGDAFVLIVAGGLITYEYIKAKSKPDQNLIKIVELTERLQDEERRVSELEEIERRQEHRVEVLEQALELLKIEKAQEKLKMA